MVTEYVPGKDFLEVKSKLRAKGWGTAGPTGVGGRERASEETTWQRPGGESKQHSGKQAQGFNAQCRRPKSPRSRDCELLGRRKEATEAGPQDEEGQRSQQQLPSPVPAPHSAFSLLTRGGVEAVSGEGAAAGR